jgi:diguanylate cyclase (GGDEF)-like protein
VRPALGPFDGRQVIEREHLEAAIDNMPIGLVLFDAGKRLIICNDRYRQLYGLPREITRRGTHLREMLEYRLGSGSFEGGEREEYIERVLKLVEQTETSVRVVGLGDGRTVKIIHHPIATGGWVGTHDDVTEREQLSARLEQQNQLLVAKEEQLRTQNIHFDAALNNMVQGLAMYDSGHRLVLCNRRFMEIYVLSPEQARVGTPLRQLIEHRVDNGLSSDMSPQELMDQLLRKRDARDFEQLVCQLGDGRSIAITVQPMADGGTVTTHNDITEQRRTEAKIAHMALHDSLTGLPNRVLLNDRLRHALNRARRGDMVAALLLDLDHFKNVNDTLGHPCGDRLLEMAAERLSSVTRDNDTVARMGGDEFAILQMAISQPSDATALALRVIDVIGAPYLIDGHQVVIGTSVGIAIGPTDGTSPEDLLRNADLALYRAKADGRGTFRFFEHGMDLQMQERRTLEADLRRAVQAGEFELHYQPVVNLESGDVRGFEALMRWRHPDKGMVPPATFIALAEEIGCIIPLGEWAIRQACATAAAWPEPLEVAVNLSPVQFSTPGLVQVVMSALAASGLPARRLELEITESTLLQDSESTLATLYNLRALGVRIAMDDFGTGYSSLSYLQSFPFDKIKIDRSFIKDVADGVGSLNIVRAVAAMAKGLGMTTTAEGVETQAQLDAVRSEGCTEMQGFLFGRPLPADELEALYLAPRRIAKGGSSQAAA